LGYQLRHELRKFGIGEPSYSLNVKLAP